MLYSNFAKNIRRNCCRCTVNDMARLLKMQIRIRLNLDFSRTLIISLTDHFFCALKKHLSPSRIDEVLPSLVYASMVGNNGLRRKNGEQRVKPRAREMKTINNNFIKYEYTSIHLEQAPKTLRS